MRILALETTSALGGAALLDGERIVAASAFDGGKGGHTRWLLGAVAHMLRDAGVPPERIDAVAVNVGPGSFTGIRIGLATAQGLAFGWGKPVVAVPGLEALAWQAVAPARPGSAVPHGLVLSLIDARHGNVYAAAYRWDVDRPSWDGAPPHQVVAPALWVAEDFFQAVRAVLSDGLTDGPSDTAHTEPIILAGDGGVQYERMAQHVLGERVRPVALGCEGLRAETVARWAQRRGPAACVPPEEARPLYFRKSEAERKWAQPVHP